MIGVASWDRLAVAKRLPVTSRPLSSRRRKPCISSAATMPAGKPA